MIGLDFPMKCVEDGGIALRQDEAERVQATWHDRSVEATLQELKSERPRRGFVRITQRGRDVLAERPVRIDLKYLSRFPELAKFRAGSAEGESARHPQKLNQLPRRPPQTCRI